MSNRWMRELRLANQAAGEATYQGPSGTGAKLLSLFLEHVLGFTFDTESVLGGTSFRSTEKGGTNGALSNANKDFVDATAGSFVVGDIGKNLVIVSSSGWNGGIYKILSYTDANTIGIDTRTAPTEYPTTETGITWFVVSDIYQRPGTTGNYIRYVSPAGWAIELKLDYAFYYRVFGIRLSPNNTWTGPTAKIIASTATYPVAFGQGGSNYYDPTASNWYLYFHGNTEGTMLHCWLENAVHGGVWGFGVGSITPAEAGHSADELLILQGPTPNHSSYNDYSRGAGWYMRDTSSYAVVGQAWGWCDNRQASRQIYAMDNAYAGASTGFSKKGGEINQRTGKNDIILGTLYMIDWDNLINEYEYLGYCNNHWSGRSNIPRRSALDVVTNKDYYHVYDGIIHAWPGVTPQI